jgi:glycosyltransferase involved in cell wall biosynthesis
MRNGISILMSVCFRDRADHLLAAMRSLVDQERPADEVVLVEDGPLDVVLSGLVEEFRSALQIKSVRLPENLGLGAALSEGLQHCSHELVARMDSDDVSLPPRLRRQAHQFDLYPRLDVLGSFAKEIDDE